MNLIKAYYEILTEPDPHILKIIELAGRNCYKSEEYIKEKSAEKFIAALIKNGHESVIEHISITVRFVTDRGVLSELSRHRICSLSVESTRYVNYKKKGLTFIIPPWVDIQPGTYSKNWSDVEWGEDEQLWFDACDKAGRDYLNLLEHGWTPEQARSVLPNSLKTDIVLTANLREWRHIFKLRTSTKAHPQMRELMVPLLAELQTKLPIIFDDINNEEKDRLAKVR